MLNIPLAPVASQTLNVTLNGQQCQIDVFQTAFGLYLDLYVGGSDEPTVAGVLCENLNRLVRSAYLGFVGDLLFYDTQGKDDPFASGLGSRFQLAYLTPVDLGGEA